MRRRGTSMCAHAGRSNRNRAVVSRTIQNSTSGKTTPQAVTISETVPRSGMMPVFSSNVRYAAIGRKKARSMMIECLPP